MTSNDRYLNNLIGQCFISGFIENIQLMMNFLNQHPDKCKKEEKNFKHF